MSRRSSEAEGQASKPLSSQAPAPHAATVEHSAWVERWIGQPCGSRRLLDFASGSGRHARLAIARGFHVLAVDRDAHSLGMLQGRGVRVSTEDLESGRWSFAAERFEVVVMTNFLFRPRIDLLAGLLEPGGRLIVETFAEGNERYGRPSNPAFLLQNDELFMTARRSGLQVIAFEQGYTSSPKPASMQRVAAVKPPHDPRSLPLDGPGHALS